MKKPVELKCPSCGGDEINYIYDGDLINFYCQRCRHIVRSFDLFGDGKGCEIRRWKDAVNASMQRRASHSLVK